MNKLLIMFFLLPTICFSQDIILPSISVPGGTGNMVIKGALLDENLVGPSTIAFSGNSFQKQRTKKSTIDELSTLYSGRIYSPGIIAPFVFENKTPEELYQIEVRVFPIMLEMPYSLYFDLTIQASSKSISSGDLDEAGQYNANITINLINGLISPKKSEK